MGITLFHAEMIVREHSFKPLPKTVHLLGRQTVLFNETTALALLSKYGIDSDSIVIEYDTSTVGAQVASENGYITDTTFFRMLGVENIYAIDHSDYEGAEIIVDLNRPIPESIESVADFIFGGSVLDNIFDPATYIKNVNRLLRPGGRLLDQNICSFHHHPYILATPAWFFDYFVLNGFDDCKVYFTEIGRNMHVYGLQVEVTDPFICDFGNAVHSLPLGIVLIAEKGKSSSWDQVPAQDQYRSTDEWGRYRSNLTAINQCKRPLLSFSTPSVFELAHHPLRKNKSFQFLGSYLFDKPNDFCGTVAPALGDTVATGIRVIEATYGGNVSRENMKMPAVFPLCRGNVTGFLAQILDGQDSATLLLDVEFLGDPAPELSKDLHVMYYFQDDPLRQLREVYIPAEAHGQLLEITPLKSPVQKGPST